MKIIHWNADNRINIHDVVSDSFILIISQSTKYTVHNTNKITQHLSLNTMTAGVITLQTGAAMQELFKCMVTFLLLW